MSFQDGPDMGHTTIICCWIFAPLACMAMGVLVVARRLRDINLGLDDYILVIAFILTLLLVAQTTWAIVDEGQGRHVEAESRTQLAMVASVRAHSSSTSTINVSP